MPRKYPTNQPELLIQGKMALCFHVVYAILFIVAAETGMVFSCIHQKTSLLQFSLKAYRKTVKVHSDQHLFLTN